MRKIILLMVILCPAPVMAAELWCMPDTLCNPEGTCKATTYEESSLRIENLDKKHTAMRAHAETMKMKRTKAGTAVEWRGTNAGGDTEYVIWSTTTNLFTYTTMNASGEVWKSTGICEVQ